MSENPRLSLESLEITNFRNYWKKNEINFSLDVDKPITVINGDMGKGKTNLMDAIYWCLYNQPRIRKNKSDTSDEPFINTNSMVELKIGEKDKTEVCLKLADEKGTLFIITRTIEFKKKNEDMEFKNVKEVDGKVPKGIDLEYKISFVERNEKGKIDEKNLINSEEKIKEKIEQYFPENLSRFFLFDAELVERSLESKQRFVKDGIEELAGLPVLDRMISNFQKVISEQIKQYSSEEGSDRQAIEKIKQECENLELEIESLKSQNDKTSEKLEELNSEKEKIFEDLRENEDVEKLNQEIEEQKLMIGEKTSEIVEQDKDFKNNLKKNIVRSAFYNTLISNEKILNQLQEKGHVPAELSEQALHKVIKNEACICGCKLNEKQIKEFEKQLSIFQSKEMGDLSTGRNQIQNIISMINSGELQLEIKNSKETRNTLLEKLEGYQVQLTTMQENFEQEKMNQNKELAEKLKKKENEIDEENRIKGALENSISENEDKLEDAQERFRKLTTKSQENEASSRIQKIAKYCIKETREIRKNLAEKLRTDAQEYTQQYYVKMVNEKIEKVEIDQNYGLMVKKNTNYNKLGSVGQSVALVLSFVAAMREITGQKYFVFMDSAYHSMSAPERLVLVEGFKEFLENTQIILLVQGQEYTSISQEKIEGKKIDSVRNRLMELGMIKREYIIEQCNPEHQKQDPLDAWAVITLHSEA